jgi:molybdopterin-containing oxidoreductase family membrane subunit
LDLGHPFRFWHVFVSPQLSSVLEWEIWFYALFVIFLLLELWFLLRCDLAQLALQESGKRRLFYKLFSLGWRCPQTEAERKTCHLISLKRVKLFSWLAILPCLAGGTGAIFSVLASKPYWFSAILPLIFLVSAITAGIASITFLFAFFFREESNYWERLVFLRRLLLIFVIFDFFLFLLEYLVGLYGEVPGHLEVYHQIMFGPFPYVFWLGQVGLAGLVPLLLLAVPKFKNTPCWVGMAALSTAIGLVAVRLNLIVPAFIIPMLKGLETAYQDARLSYFYFPSFWEWASSLGLIAFFGLLFIALFNLLPLKKSDL